MSQTQGKSGGRKIGRSTVKCARYRAQMKREKNKAKRVMTPLKKQPMDEAAFGTMEKLKVFLDRGSEIAKFNVFCEHRERKIGDLRRKRAMAKAKKRAA